MQVARVPAHWGYARMSSAVADPLTMEGARHLYWILELVLILWPEIQDQGVKGEPGFGV